MGAQPSVVEEAQGEESRGISIMEADKFLPLTAQ